MALMALMAEGSQIGKPVGRPTFRVEAEAVGCAGVGQPDDQRAVQGHGGCGGGGDFERVVHGGVYGRGGRARGQCVAVGQGERVDAKVLAKRISLKSESHPHQLFGERNVWQGRKEFLLCQMGRPPRWDDSVGVEPRSGDGLRHEHGGAAVDCEGAAAEDLRCGEMLEGLRVTESAAERRVLSPSGTHSDGMNAFAQQFTCALGHTSRKYNSSPVYTMLGILMEVSREDVP
ncbi:hypothetical protein B0H17DRAFT_1143388 [Mycena rosella]|uniref:Uncharacterized protein n=1 Tax=Mycena rosella TaxID=1033263 RepID=A0AAD7G439_MYCRO|nr:hypothetical protein B0H17DRAFT_1143388 [Mycena rosella]